MKKPLRILTLAAGLMSTFVLASNAQTTTVEGEDDQMVIPPLFEYVVAPEDLPDLQARTDYLMDHFWDPFDFKVATVDQNALNHAFGVYSQAMAFASEKKVKDSVRDLVSKIKKNPGLTYQFTKAAEENLYGPRADLWADDIYLEFLKNLLENKKIGDSKKKRYQSQYSLLTENAIGSTMPTFRALNSLGTSTTLPLAREFALVGFIPSDCPDCSYTMLKLDISGVVNDLIEDNRLEVDLVYIDEMPPADLPAKWTPFKSEDAANVLDIRFTPGFYVVGKDGKIAGKNLHVDNAINLLEALSR